MSKAKLCTCGHNASDHKQLARNRSTWGECFWDECPCEKYKFEGLHDPNLGAGKKWEDLPTLINANTGDYFTKKNKRKTPLFISECGPKGKHYDFQKQEHEYNGEYI